MKPPRTAQELAGPLPPDVLIINDDHEAQLIALYFNATDALRDPGTIAGPRMAELVCEEHPTHWIYFARAWEQPDPTENGWCVMFVPKRGETREEFWKNLQAGHDPQ